MLKLLIREDRYTLKKEFMFRFLNILFAFTILGLIITGTLLFAPYVLVEYQKNVTADQVNSLQSSENAKLKTDLHTITSELKKDFDIFKVPTPEYSNYIDEILEKTTNSITLNSLNIKKAVGAGMDGQDVLAIELQGIARTRNSLVDYADALRASENFVQVSLPLSNLTRDTQIPFIISIETADIKIQ